jgi:hypothetical protein
MTKFSVDVSLDLGLGLWTAISPLKQEHHWEIASLDPFSIIV